MVCQGHSKKRSTPGENHQEVNSHSGNKDESIIMTKYKCAICNENNQLDQQGEKNVKNAKPGNTRPTRMNHHRCSI